MRYFYEIVAKRNNSPDREAGGGGFRTLNEAILASRHTLNGLLVGNYRVHSLLIGHAEGPRNNRRIVYDIVN